MQSTFIAQNNKENLGKLWMDDFSLLIWLIMAKIDTLFMTKMAEKPYPLGPHIPI